jgi:hypothetical protein
MVNYQKVHEVNQNKKNDLKVLIAFLVLLVS